MNEVIAVDMGYGFTKGLRVSRPEPAILASAYAQVGRQLHDGAKRQRLHVWDEDWYFGDDALKYAHSPITSRDRNRPKEMLEVLLVGLLSELGVYEGKLELHMALPVEWLPDADKLRGLFTGRHIGRRLDQGNKRVDVYVGRDTGSEIERSGVFFYPQPFATFLSRASTDESLWHNWATVLVIDVGTGTFNECLIVGGEWLDERATSKPHGMGEVLEKALQDQEAQTKSRDLLHIARSKLWTMESGMISLCKPHVEALAEDVLQTAADIAGNVSLSKVILTGGGAHYVQSQVRGRFQDLVDMSGEPELDNVRGLLAAAV